MPSTNIKLNEADVIKLIAEFLQTRSLDLSLLSLERETGIVNGNFSDDALFLRQLILDGQWDDVSEFVQPLLAVPAFNYKTFHFIITKHQFLELLCIRSEHGISPVNIHGSDELEHSEAVNEINKCLTKLEELCPTRDEYNKLCLLLSLNQLSDHPDYINWNPHSGRLECFREIFPLVEVFLTSELMPDKIIAQNDRLVQLLIKGLLYESAVEFCQHKATAAPEEIVNIQLPILCTPSTMTDADLSLISWLQSLPDDVFACQFEQRSLKLHINQMEKPSLEASWSEQILATPVKPKLFPYTAVPNSRPRAAELMSRSLNLRLDGLAIHDMRAKASAQQHPSHSNYSNGIIRQPQPGESATPVSSVLQSRSTSSEANRKNELITDDRRQASFSPQNVTHNNFNQTSTHRIPADVESSGTDLKSVGDDVSSPRDDSKHSSSVNSTDNSSRAANPMRESQSDLFREYQRQKVLRSSEIFDNNSPLSAVHTDNFDSDRKNSHINVDNFELNNDPISESHHNKTSLKTQQFPEDKLENPIDHLHDQSVEVLSSINKLRNNVNSANSPHLALSRSNKVINISQLEICRVDGGVVINEISDTMNSFPKFIPISTLEDIQAIRASAFHPRGHLYAVGSNSKMLRVCQFPDESSVNFMTSQNGITQGYTIPQTSVIYRKPKHHKGSIYCIAWSQSGDLIATGSNDKAVRLLRWDDDKATVTPPDAELTFHAGTVRDITFMQGSGANSLMISAGAGDCKIYITDCETQTSLRSMSGHTGHVYSLDTWGGCMLASGSQDKTARIWDLRTNSAVSIIPSVQSQDIGKLEDASAFASVYVDSSGRLLVSGHENSTILLYDLRGQRKVQSLQSHKSEVRSVALSSGSEYYLLSGSYDRRVNITDLHGELTKPLNSSTAAVHADKVIQVHWHPTELAFISTSADRSCTCWMLYNPSSLSN